jgi:hypothetical protein
MRRFGIPSAKRAGRVDQRAAWKQHSGLDRAVDCPGPRAIYMYMYIHTSTKSDTTLLLGDGNGQWANFICVGRTGLT